MSKKIKVTNGVDTFEVNSDKLQLALNDGFRPTERIIVSNTQSGETYEVNPDKVHLAYKDGFTFKDLPLKKKEPTSDDIAKRLVGGAGKMLSLLGYGGMGGKYAGQSEEKIKQEVKVKPSFDLKNYNSGFEMKTGMADIDLGSQSERTQEERNRQKYIRYRDIEENEIKPFEQNVFSGRVTKEQLQNFANQPFGKKVVKDIVRQHLGAELSDGILDKEVFRSDVNAERLAEQLQNKFRGQGVESQNQALFDLDNQLYNEVDGLTAKKTYFDAQSEQMRTTEVPFKKIDTNNPTELGQLLREVDAYGSDYSFSNSRGEPISPQGIRDKIRQKLFFIKANEPIHPEVEQVTDRILEAVNKMDIGWKKNLGYGDAQKQELATRDAAYIKEGLNYLRDENPVQYKNAINALNEKGELGQLAYGNLINIGKQMDNQKRFQYGEKLFEDNRDFSTPEIRQEKLSHILSEKIKAKGYKNRAVIPDKVILQAYNELPNELKDDESLQKIRVAEAAPAYGFISFIPQGEGIVKGGAINAFFRGVTEPLKNIQETFNVLTQSPTETYLNSQKLSRGDQKLIDYKTGGVTNKLPSEKGKFLNDIIEGTGQFLTQYLSSVAIGKLIQAPALAAARYGVPAPILAGGEAALKSNINAYVGGFLSTAAQTYGQSYIDFLNKTGDPSKAKLMAFIDATGQSALEVGVLPDVKMVEGFANAWKTGNKNLAKDISNALAKGATKSQVFDIAKNFVLGGGKIWGKEVLGEEVAQNFANFLTESIFSPQTAEKRNVLNESWETIKGASVSMAVPILLGGFTGVKSNRQSSITKDALNTLSTNLSATIESLDEGVKTGVITEQERNDAVAIIEAHSKNIENAPKEDANGNLLSAKKRLEYAYQTTAKQFAKDKAESLPDDIQKEPLTAEIKESEDLQRKIVNGDKIDELEEKDIEPELTEEQTIIKQAIDKGEIKEKMFVDLAERALNDAEFANQLISEARSQSIGDVAGEMGNAESGIRNTWGNTIAEYVTPQSQPTVTTPSTVLSRGDEKRTAKTVSKRVAVEHAGYEGAKRVTGANENTLELDGYGTVLTSQFINKLVDNGRLPKEALKNRHIQLTDEYATKLLNENSDLFPKEENKTNKDVGAVAEKTQEDKDTLLVDGIKNVSKNKQASDLLRIAMNRGVIPETLYNDFGKELASVKITPKSKTAIVDVAEIIQKYSDAKNEKTNSVIKEANQAIDNAEFERRAYADMTEQEKFEAVIEDKAQTSGKLTPEELKFVNENYFAPKGYRYNENFELIKPKDQYLSSTTPSNTEELTTKTVIEGEGKPTSSDLIKRHNDLQFEIYNMDKDVEVNEDDGKVSDEDSVRKLFDVQNEFGDKYNDIELPNGKWLSVRISDHSGNVKNTDSERNLSFVITNDDKTKQKFANPQKQYPNEFYFTGAEKFDSIVKFINDRIDEIKKEEQPTKGEVTINQQPQQQTPPIPPQEPPVTNMGTEGDGDDYMNKKAVLNRLYNAQNVPEAAKREFEKERLDYVPSSQTEAMELAKSIIDEYGVDKAVRMAESSTLFSGDVRTLIFAEALNRLQGEENAKKWAEVAISLDIFGRDSGRAISAINYFYKNNPYGVILKEEADRKDAFDAFSKNKEESWKDYIERIKEDPDFKEFIKERVSEELKKERIAARAKRIKKVREVFKKAKESVKTNNTYAIIIPPHILETAIEAMELLYEAGESVAHIISTGINHITDKLGNNNWDTEKFRKEWEEKLKDSFSTEEAYQNLLKKQIADLDEQIADRKRKEPKVKTKKEYSEETKKLIEERDAKKEKLDELVPIPQKQLTDEEKKQKVLDKFRNKLKGLNDRQRDAVVRKMFDKVVQNGALEYEDLRQIIADTLGYGKLSEAESKKIKELVAKRNSVVDAAKKVHEERTKESLIEHTKTQLEAGKAARELDELLWNNPDVLKRLVSVMQLSTLGIPALINNPVYNFFNQLGVRFPVGLINTAADSIMAGIAKMTGKSFVREYNIIDGQSEFWKAMGVGSKEAVKQVLTGLNRMDYMQKEVYGNQLRPFRAWRDLMAAAQGKKSLSNKQIWDKALQALPGIPAEIVARLLNVGDKPMRFASEGAQAAAFAKALNLKDIDKAIFIEFPREEAYRIYKGQGLSDEKAAQMADYVKEAIIKEGQRSTFQQDNLLNDAITGFFNLPAGKLGLNKDSGAAQLAKTLTVSPYIKIPSNAFWSMYNIVNPEIAMVQAIVHGARAYNFNKKGDTKNAKLQLREARYWTAHGIVGLGYKLLFISLVAAGVFVPSPDDESKKERSAQSLFELGGSVNVDKLLALMSFRDPSEVKDGTLVSNRWFGQVGAVGNIIARRWFDATPEQRENMTDFWNIVLSGFEFDALKEAENGVFANSSSLLQSLSTGDFSRYGLNTLNLFANIIQPASVAQFERAMINEVPQAKGDNFIEKLNQSFAQRSVLYRKLFDVKIDKKTSMWGEPTPKNGNVLSRMFGVSKVNPQLEGRPMYNDYLRTSDAGFLPPDVQNELNGVKLNNKQYNDLQKYVGQSRKMFALPFINGDMPMSDGRVYSELPDDEKKSMLSGLYDKGRKAGLEQFYTDYPEFKPKEETEEDKYKKKIIEKSLKQVTGK